MTGNTKTETKNKKRVGFVHFILAPFFLIGIVALTLSLFLLMQSVLAQSWIAVEAEVVKKELPSSKSTGTYTSLSYWYQFEGKNYQSEDLQLRVPFNSRMLNRLENKLRTRIQDAKQVVAYVNPQQPAEATLYKGVSNATISILIWALAWNGIISLFTFPVFFGRFFSSFSKTYVIGVVVFFFLSVFLAQIDYMGDYPARQIEILE